jgi:hypothetical protein
MIVTRWHAVRLHSPWVEDDHSKSGQVQLTPVVNQSYVAVCIYATCARHGRIRENSKMRLWTVDSRHKLVSYSHYETFYDYKKLIGGVQGG